MNTELLKLKDGSILNIEQDNWCASHGCETCGWGSSYISEVDITMENHKICIKSDSMYEFSLSDGILMKTILQNYNEIQEMTEVEFYNWLVLKLQDECEITHDIYEK
jgi:hypothetical protein